MPYGVLGICERKESTARPRSAVLCRHKRSGTVLESSSGAPGEFGRVRRVYPKDTGCSVRYEERTAMLLNDAAQHQAASETAEI